MTSTLTRRRLACCLAVAALATTLAACASTSSSSSGSPASAGGTPVDGGTLTFYDPVEYTAWVPTNSIWSNSQVSGNLGERLIWQDPKTGGFKPWLAASWEISADHLAYTFHLKPGITFSNGDPLDAGTVKLNFDQHGLGDKALGIPQDGFWAGYAGTEVVDASTLKVKLKAPDAGFLQVLSNYRASTILGKPFLAQNLEGQGRAKNWVGTGPFVVDSVSGTTGITLKRREDYHWPPDGSGHQGKAHLQKIVFKTVPEASTRVGALQSGEADIARNIAPADEETVVANGDTLVAIPVQGGTNKLAVQLGPKAPAATKDLKVRQALQAATDREEINRTVLTKNYPVPSSALVKGTPLRSDSSRYLTYDLAKATSLLTEAGWTPGPDGIRVKGGEKLHFDIWVSPYYQVSQNVLELLQSQWKKAGIDLRIHGASLTEYEAISTAGGSGDAKWAFEQGQTSTADPNVLRVSYSSSRYNELGQDKAAPDRTLDTLVQAQAGEFDPEKRKAAVKAAEDYLFQQAYAIPLYDETQVFALAPRVHGYATESTGRSWFYDTWLSR